MRLMVIGVGDCGCRLAREFAELNKTAKSEGHSNIITCAYAVNNDQKLLTEVTRSGGDWLRPVTVHGVLAGESTEAGAKLMRHESERVMLAMRLGAFVNTDAFLFVASTAGSLGSGGVPVMIQLLKERHIDKPVYALLVLPFDAELDDPQRVRNTALCLKSIEKVADAVILADNGGLGMLGNIAPPQKMGALNKELVAPFYDLLCSGEMTGSKSIVGKVLDAGDIAQTLIGWTAIGIGKVKMSSSKLPWKKIPGFEEKSSESLKALEAMNLALMRLSVDCKLEDAGRALYLLSAPAGKASIDMIKDLGNRLRELAPHSEIRDGSFYGDKNFTKVTVIVSELIYVDRIRNYYDRAARMTRVATGEEKTDLA
ncbi:MAG: cell division protein FtsZ [Chloroflexota bacterium]|nr:MAG: cell division protein FtsZ [Chloroflexota bacterium]